MKDISQIYLQIDKLTCSPRETEAKALSRAAHKLMACRDNWEGRDRKKELKDALQFNQKLWSLLQADLVSPENRLPVNTKVDLLRLSYFVDKQIFKTMIDPSPDKLTPIININLRLAAGLRKKTPEDGGDIFTEKDPFPK
ncbi:MAG: flagellar biosynthesis regulator FlaF [Syntrophaceae bacterium]